MNKSAQSVIWLEIKSDLELKIINGTYKIAGRMPSISELTELYSCGDSTAQKVLESLYAEGLLTKKRGIGYFVKPLCREKLIEKHMEALENLIAKLVKEAHALGIDKKTLIDLTDKQIHSTYSP